MNPFFFLINKHNARTSQIYERARAYIYMHLCTHYELCQVYGLHATCNDDPHARARTHTHTHTHTRDSLRKSVFLFAERVSLTRAMLAHRLHSHFNLRPIRSHSCDTREFVSLVFNFHYIYFLITRSRDGFSMCNCNILPNCYTHA